MRGHDKKLMPFPEAGERAASLSPHLEGAVSWAAQFGAMAEANKGANAANRRQFAVILALVVTCGVIYRSTRVVMYAREVDANGVALRTTKLEQITEASEAMKRDAVQKFLRGLRSSSMDLRYQEVLSKMALTHTAGGSPAHQAVEEFNGNELPARREQEIDAQVTAHPLSDTKWRADIVETTRLGDKRVLTAYVTVDVAVEADRDVELNPWGVFVRSFSIDSLGGSDEK